MKLIISGIVGLIIGFLNGIFGSGGGSFLIIYLEKFIKLKPHKAHATSISITLPLTIISALIYFKNIEIDLLMLLYISLGGLVGGYIGAKFLNKIPENILHKVFGIFMIASSIKMVFS